VQFLRERAVLGVPDVQVADGEEAGGHVPVLPDELRMF
jgi:hypothetical protein